MQVNWNCFDFVILKIRFLMIEVSKLDEILCLTV